MGGIIIKQEQEKGCITISARSKTRKKMLWPFVVGKEGRAPIRIERGTLNSELVPSNIIRDFLEFILSQEGSGVQAHKGLLKIKSNVSPLQMKEKLEELIKKHGRRSDHYVVID